MNYYIEFISKDEYRKAFGIHLLPTSLASCICSLSLCSSPCDKWGVCVWGGVLCVCALSQVGLSDLFF